MLRDDTLARTLRHVLADQLSLSLVRLKEYQSSSNRVMMTEIMTEVSYVKHHKKNIVLLFSAMRHFADELVGKGYRVRYIKLV